MKQSDTKSTRRQSTAEKSAPVKDSRTTTARSGATAARGMADKQPAAARGNNPTGRNQYSKK